MNFAPGVDPIFDVNISQSGQLTKVRVEDVWISLESANEVTLIPNSYLFIGFVLMLIGHVAISTRIKGKNFGLKAILGSSSDFLCPMPFKDWDERLYIDLDQQRKLVRNVKLELGYKVVSFALENALMSLPLGFLYWGALSRDELLFEIHFDPLEEELAATRRALTMFIASMVTFLLVIPILQTLLWYIYYNYGHPWAKLYRLLTKKNDIKRKSKWKSYFSPNLNLGF